jgi:hypothetical protein
LENWKHSQELRCELQKRKKSDNPLKAIVPVRGEEAPKEEWMSEKAWNVAGWQETCKERLAELYKLNHF